MSEVTVVGLDGGPLREAALAALSRAALVVGWPEHVAAVRHLLPPRAAVREIDRDLPRTVEALRSAPQDARVVLTSGDPGFHGVVDAVRAVAAEVVVVPAVSCITAAFAAAGLAWEDAHLVSAHREPPHRAVAVCRRFGKVAVLTDESFGPSELGAALAGVPRTLLVAERLGLRGQQLTRVTPAEASTRTWAHPNVVLVVEEEGAPSVRSWSTPPRWTGASWALPGGGLHPALSALALGWLGPGLGDLLWVVGDRGLAVEASGLGAAVLAFEGGSSGPAPGAPLTFVPGRAPAAFAGLADPDAVAVVGGDHLLIETLRVAADRARRAVVVVLPAVDRVGAVAGALEERGLEVASTLVSTSEVARGVASPAEPTAAVGVVGGWRR